MDQTLSPLLRYLPDWVAQELDRLPLKQQGEITELRLRRDKSVGLCLAVLPVLKQPQLTPWELEQTLLRFCDYSMQSCQEQLRQGYIALPGGHRVGFADRPFTVRENSSAWKKFKVRISGSPGPSLDWRSRTGLLFSLEAASFLAAGRRARKRKNHIGSGSGSLSFGGWTGSGGAGGSD